MQVASSFSRYKDCNGSCVDKSFFCPPKDVCEFPKLLCFNKCQPASYRRWYQVGICPFYCSVLPKHLIWCAATNVCHLTLLAVWYKVCPSEELHFVCGQTEIQIKSLIGSSTLSSVIGMTLCSFHLST